ncbi:MAG: hypothetical protein KJO22_05525, partial [Bacteroidia bacterium]|nr:hypothetical protein [Bacteroidia bacterium]
ALLITITSLAQGYGINYKAVIKDDSGNILSNENLKVKFAILDLSDNIAYGATHTTTTDANGIIILNIGSGTEDVIGDYFGLDWVSGFYRLSVEIDIAPCDTFVPLGTTPFQAVPLALGSLDNLWQLNGDNAIALGEKVGIGTSTPTELLHLEDPNNAGIKLETPDYTASSNIKLENGDVSGFHTFFKIENFSDVLSISVDSDLNSGETGYVEKLSISPSGNLALSTGTSINEFSTDGTLAGNSNNAVPTEAAVKTYVDNVLAPTSKTMVIPASAFYAAPYTGFELAYNGTIAKCNSDSYPYEMYAPVILPVGSTITNMVMNMRDNDPVNNVTISLEYANGLSVNPSAYFYSNTSGATSTGQTLTYTDPITISGTTRQHFIVVQSVWGAVSDIGVSNVAITYTE